MVYFGDAGDQFAKDELSVRCKEPAGARLLCYCFGETEAGIRAELREHGCSKVVERIRRHISAGRCTCEIRNPRGSCCLGDVVAALKRLEMALPVGQDQW